MNLLQAIHTLHTFAGTQEARKVVKAADRKQLRADCTTYANWIKRADGLLSVGPNRIGSTGETVYERVLANARKRTSGIEDYPHLKEMHELQTKLNAGKQPAHNDVSLLLFAAAYAEIDEDGWKKG